MNYKRAVLGCKDGNNVMMNRRDMNLMKQVLVMVLDLQ